ncbi:unnamed protein product, partial [Rotaria magnacalcarata]
LEEGKHLVELLIDPQTLDEDFTDINDLINRLCLKRTFQTTLIQLQINED